MVDERVLGIEIESIEHIEFWISHDMVEFKNGDLEFINIWKKQIVFKLDGYTRIMKINSENNIETSEEYQVNEEEARWIVDSLLGVVKDKNSQEFTTYDGTCRGLNIYLCNGEIISVPGNVEVPGVKTTSIDLMENYEARVISRYRVKL